jgi:hypothetical protein
MSGVAAALAAAAAIAGVHEYQGVSLSPKGDLTAAVESYAAAGRAKEPHGAVVVRKAADGTVVASYDPCVDCRYGGTSWSPDGSTLAFVATDPAHHTSSLMLVQGGAPKTALGYDGLIANPRFSPDGKALSVLATQ